MLVRKLCAAWLGLSVWMVVDRGTAEAACTGASPTWTSTPDYVSIGSCVGSAAPGDTIQVTPGNGMEAWPGPISLTRGVSLIGPGSDKLTVTSADVLVAVAPDAPAIDGDEIIRVSGFTFDGQGTALNLVTVSGAGATSAKPFRNLVIDNNKLQNTGDVTSGSGAISSVGQVRGVIYENVFDGCNVILKIMGNDDTAEWESRAPHRCK